MVYSIVRILCPADKYGVPEYYLYLSGTQNLNGADTFDSYTRI